MNMDKRRVNVRALIYNDGKILAVKHKSETGEEPAYWAVPGGGLDPFESLEEGVAREVYEELGIKAQVGRLLFVQQFKSTRPARDEGLEFIFLIENADDFLDIDLSKSTHGEAELARCEFIDPQTETIMPSLLSKLDLKSYSERIHPVFFYAALD